MAPSFTSFRGSRPPRRRMGHPWLRLLIILVLVFVVINFGLTPWVLHIGGRFTPLTQWTGYGPVRGSNGGDYVLYTQLRGGLLVASSGGRGASCSQLGGCDDLSGTAKLCTENGTTYTFRLTGQVHAWLSTDGARTSLAIDGGTPRRLPFEIVFDGAWHGPVLRVANTDDAFTQVFTPRGVIRSSNSTANNGHASATLRFGSEAAFASACRALAGHRAR